MVDKSLFQDPVYSNSSYVDDDLVLIKNVKALNSSDSVRIEKNVIAFVSKGRLTAEYNGKPIVIPENHVFICPPKSQLTHVMISPDFQFLALGITTNAMQTYLREYMNLWNQFTYVEHVNVLPMDTRAGLVFYKNISTLIRMLLTPAEDTEERIYRNMMLKNALKIILIALCNLLRKQPTAEINKPKLNISYFNQFLDLLQNTESKHQTLEYYASQLCISTKYLTEICKKNSGKTANKWIQEYTLADITRYLKTTNLSIKEIAAKVGFDNTSFFGKYVKDHFGCTPLEYRNR